MGLMLIIECDNCLENLVVDIEKNNAIDSLKSIEKETRKEIKDNGWHALKKCLCPECMSKEGSINCMNCAHMAYKDYNYRCCREINREAGLVVFEGSVVSEYDNCEHFEPRKYKNPIPEVE